MDSKLLKAEDAQSEELADYDLIGFGSGIYGYNHIRFNRIYRENAFLGEESIYFLNHLKFK